MAIPFNENWRLMARRAIIMPPDSGIDAVEGARLRSLRPTMRPVRLPSYQAVRAVIAASLLRGEANLDGTARALGVSSRTLQRHLGDLGTTHSKILAEVRVKIACRLLQNSSKRLSDIAKFVGYTNASSFSRNFTRLMKIQPVMFRRQQLSRKQR